MSEQYKQWLQHARDDLKFAFLGLKNNFYTQVCFLSQQVIEKSLKGALVAFDRPYPKSHNLRELAKKLPELSLKDYIGSITIIDSYYTPIRYPDTSAGMKSSGPPNKKEAKQAYDTAKEIYNYVLHFLE